MDVSNCQFTQETSGPFGCNMGCGSVSMRPSSCMARMHSEKPLYRIVPLKRVLTFEPSPYSSPYCVESRFGNPSSAKPGKKFKSFGADIKSPPPKISTTWPRFRYLAADKVLSNAARGDHENLYRNELLEHSGAGNPPQKLINDSMEPPLSWTSLMHSSARKWSMPGSKPTSFRIVTPDLSATSCSDRTWSVM